MVKILAAIAVVAALIILLIQRSRRRSILNTAARNKYFRKIAEKLGMNVGGDEYYLHLEGTWNGFKVLLLPYNFHGPGIITLIYVETMVPRRDRTWIEPTLGLGRAIIEAEHQRSFSFEVSGDTEGLPVDHMLNQMKEYSQKFPYVAFTLPERFILSPYLTPRDAWPNFMVFLALDAGRKPPLERLQDALNCAVTLAQNAKASPEKPL